jgi:hypothetical protein
MTAFTGSGHSTRLNIAIMNVCTKALLVLQLRVTFESLTRLTGAYTTARYRSDRTLLGFLFLCASVLAVLARRDVLASHGKFSLDFL